MRTQIVCVCLRKGAGWSVCSLSGQSCTKAGLWLASELQVGPWQTSVAEGDPSHVWENEFEVCVCVLHCYLWEHKSACWRRLKERVRESEWFCMDVVKSGVGVCKKLAIEVFIFTVGDERLKKKRDTYMPAAWYSSLPSWGCSFTRPMTTLFSSGFWRSSCQSNPTTAPPSASLIFQLFILRSFFSYHMFFCCCFYFSFASSLSLFWGQDWTKELFSWDVITVLLMIRVRY